MADTKVESRAEQRHEDTSARGAGESAGGRSTEGRLGGIHNVATEGVFLVRDVASDTVRAVGDVGVVAVDTTHDLLVGVADGLRDVIAHVIPFGRSSRETTTAERAERK